MKKYFLPLLALLAVSCSTGFDVGTIDKSEWMSFLPDSTPGCEISIPGAHDACTAGVDEEYSWFRTQTLDIQQMWDAGVRSFDLRPAACGNELSIYHDVAATHTSFEEVVGILEDNLERHPGEFAVVVFRHEDVADTSDNFESLMGRFLGAGLREGVAIDFREDLTLGELRGHILFFARARYDGGPLGAYVRDWDDYPVYVEDEHALLVNSKGETSVLRVQDHYGPDAREDKLSAVFDLMDHTAKTPVWTLNHTSGYMSFSKSYGENARNVNSAVAEHIRSLDGHAGIVVMDFAGADTFRGPYVFDAPVSWDYRGEVSSVEWNVGGAELVDTIIEHNFI